MISSTRPMSDLTRPEWCMQFVICFDLYTTSHSHSICHTHVKTSSPHFYIISFSAHFLFHPVILQLFLHVPWIIHSVFTQSSQNGTLSRHSHVLPYTLVTSSSASISSVHYTVVHLLNSTLSSRPRQHPSLWPISQLSFFPNHTYFLFLLKPSSASISSVHITDVHLFLAHLKLPHIIPHMIYHTSPTFHPHSITSTPTKSPSVSPIVHL